MKFGILAAVLIAILPGCAGDQHRLVIVPLHPYYKDNNYDTIKQRYRYFLLKESGKNVDRFNQVKSFVFNNLDNNYSLYNAYEVVVYRETRKTNELYRDKESDMIEWHGKDIIFTFDWVKGKYIGHFEYENGRIINKRPVNIIDITTE